jgi:aminoglycoside 3-N-acetyltransferase
MTATRAAVALCTFDSLRADLRALGVTDGMTLMVHASLNKVGYLVGGPVALIHALLDVLGTEGTLVMPCESPQVCRSRVLERTARAARVAGDDS